MEPDSDTTRLRSDLAKMQVELEELKLQTVLHKPGATGEEVRTAHHKLMEAIDAEVKTRQHQEDDVEPSLDEASVIVERYRHKYLDFVRGPGLTLDPDDVLWQLRFIHEEAMAKLFYHSHEGETGGLKMLSVYLDQNSANCSAAYSELRRKRIGAERQEREQKSKRRWRWPWIRRP